MDYDHLDSLRQHHPAWRLLRSEHAALIGAFLHKRFIAPNLRGVAAAELAEALEDELYGLRQRLGGDSFPKSAMAYLNDWAAPDKGWLRKYYLRGSDEPQFDLAPSTEKAIGWLATLGERSFVGTESRLLTLFALLRQMREGSEADPQRRLAELERRRAEIDAQIAQVKAGELSLLDDSALKDRFQQFLQGARELLADFREVEHNFRGLDRRVRERIALWEGSKGALLADILGERDAIADSDQGRSFRAFWDFLMSRTRQEELTELLDEVLELPAVQAMEPEPRLRRVHYDWLDAGEHTQRTVAQLSQQLRRFLDDQAWLENRRIMELLQGIEGRSLRVREQAPTGEWMTIEASSAAIELPLERPPHQPTAPVALNPVALSVGDDAMATDALFEQIVVDRPRLQRQIRQALEQQAQISLRELVLRHPLQHGLAELITYLQLAQEQPSAVDEQHEELIEWRAEDDAAAVTRRARLPRLIFVRRVPASAAHA
jgi:hypothetical protein